MKRFSLISLLGVVAILAVMTAFGWPIVRSSFIEYSVTDSTSNGGWEFATAQSAEALRASGEPTFIYNMAYSKAISYLDGTKLPYLIVVHHDDGADFTFDSQFATDGLNVDGFDVFVSTRFSFGNQKFNVKYSLKNVAADENAERRIIESLTINGDQIDLTNGRLIQTTIGSDGYTLHQSLASDLSLNIFRTRYRDDRDRVLPVLEWWRNRKTNVEVVTD